MTEAHKGKILVINNGPHIEGSIPLWEARPMYQYTVVKSVHEAEVLAELMDFDAVVHSNDFPFVPFYLSHACESPWQSGLKNQKIWTDLPIFIRGNNAMSRKGRELPWHQE